MTDWGEHITNARLSLRHAEEYLARGKLDAGYTALGEVADAIGEALDSVDQQRKAPAILRQNRGG